MSIASELTNLEGNIEDSYDAVNDMGGVIPAQRNMDNLDQAIRTIPQSGSSVTVTSTPATQYSGSSTTDAISQQGAYLQVHGTNDGIKIGGNTEAATSSATGVAIGGGAYSTGNYSVAIGNKATVTGIGTVVVGGSQYGVQTTHNYAVALGYRSRAGRHSEVSIGDGSNNADYGKRYLANVKDGVRDDDACTVGQLNTAIAGVSLSTISQADWDALFPSSAAFYADSISYSDFSSEGTPLLFDSSNYDPTYVFNECDVMIYVPVGYHGMGYFVPHFNQEIVRIDNTEMIGGPDPLQYYVDDVELSPGYPNELAFRLTGAAMPPISYGTLYAKITVTANDGNQYTIQLRTAD